MSKAFTRENDASQDDEDDVEVAPLPSGTRNYMTPGGFARLKSELDHLVGRERPELVATVAWAASNGDRSENGDYLYGKKRLREIDRRIRFLIKRLDQAEVVDPAAPREPDAAERVFFGATVSIRNQRGRRAAAVDRRHRRGGHDARLRELDLPGGARAAPRARGRHGERRHPGRHRGARGARGRLPAARDGRGPRGGRWLTLPSGRFYSGRAMDADLDELERKVAALIACAQTLREANETLARALGDARERERDFAQRMEAARGRLDALIEQLPH